MTIEVDVSFSPEHFNSVAYCNVPAVWTAEVTNLDEVGSELGFGRASEFAHYSLYEYGDTREEAIDGLLGYIKQYGIEHGRLRVRG